MNTGKICISVCAETTDEFVKNIEHAEDLADVIELRFDCLKELKPEILWKSIKNRRAKFRGKFLATLRPPEQGGKQSLTAAQRTDFWLNSRVSEFVEWADLEPDFSEEQINHVSVKTFDKVIKSFHDFEKVPSNIIEIYSRLGKESELIKIAVQADDIADTIAVWKLLEQANRDGKQIIPIAMGEAGKWTRILGLAHGAPLTYAALESGKETASGQISAADLIEVYRVRELDEQTEIYGILGNPVSHSLSPYIHNAAFKFHSLNAVFVPFEVKNLDAFISRFVRRETREVTLNFKGFSVTAPHKQAIIKHLDSIDETAEIIGAVNTVKIIDGKLHGYNTDAAGFIEPLKNAYGNLKNVEAAVLGSGGAARAVIYALKKEGANVAVFARNAQKAKDLASEFHIETGELADGNGKLETARILVNATPLGTKGASENETPVVAEQLKNAHLVYDLVYNPFETRLLREAKSADVPTIGGLAMLIAQAMEQSLIWTGHNAPMKEMSRAALVKLQNR